MVVVLRASEGKPSPSIKVTMIAGYVLPSAGSLVGTTERDIPVAKVGGPLGVVGSAAANETDNGNDPKTIKKSRATASGALFLLINWGSTPVYAGYIN